MRALVLNKHWIPVNVVSFNRALSLLFTGRAYCLDHINFVHYELMDWMQISDSLPLKKVHTAKAEFAVPEVLLLREFNGIPRKRVKYSKMNVLYRDKFICQYCGKTFPADELTIDHVMPRCRGGRTSWTNVVTACGPCNKLKDNRTTDESGMYPMKSPKEPTGTNPLFCLSSADTILESWRKFLFK